MSYTNTSATFSLPAGQVVGIRTQISEGAKFEAFGPMGNASDVVNDQSSKTFGPYQEAKQISITALYGTIEYDYGLTVNLPSFSYMAPQTEGSGGPLKYALGYRENSAGQKVLGLETQAALTETGVTVPRFVNGKDYGLKFDGSDSYASVQAWINGAKDYAVQLSAAQGRAVLVGLTAPTGAIFNLNNQLTFDVTYLKADFNDALSLWTNDLSCGINAVGSGYDTGPQFAKYYQNGTAIKNLRMIYAGQSASAAGTGLRLTGQLGNQQQTPSGVEFENITIRGFSVGLGFTGCTYLNTFERMSLSYCGTAIRPDNTSFGFERMMLRDLLVFNNAKGFDLTGFANGTVSEWFIKDASFDYNSDFHIMGKYNSQIFWDGGHCEGSNVATPSVGFASGHPGDGLFTKNVDFISTAAIASDTYFRFQENSSFKADNSYMYNLIGTGNSGLYASTPWNSGVVAGCNARIQFDDSRLVLGQSGPLHFGGSKNNFNYFEDGTRGFFGAQVIGAANFAGRLSGTNLTLAANNGKYEIRKAGAGAASFELFIPFAEGKRGELGFSLEDIAAFGAVGTYNVTARWCKWVLNPTTGLFQAIYENAIFSTSNNVAPGAAQAVRKLIIPGFSDNENSQRKPSDCNGLHVVFDCTNLNTYSAGAVVPAIQNVAATLW